MNFQFTVAAIALALFVSPEMKAQQTEYLRTVTVTPTPAKRTAPAASKPVAKPVSKTAPKTSPARAVVAAPTPVPMTAAARGELNNISQFIAGLPVTSGSLAAMEQTPQWTNFAASMNSRWKRFDANRLQPIRVWTETELRHASANRVFYPFSGPDAIYVMTMFPNATTYILCGLEPVGDLPSMEKLQPLDASLGWLQASMKTLVEAGYFVTKDMSVELKMSPLQGTMPLMCMMIARSGGHITWARRDATHAEIRFMAANGGPERTMHYFSADLSNGGMGKGSGFLNFLRQARPDAAYVKSASYLMHEAEFSAVRNFLLTQCSTIVQDDSGVPLRDFDARRWKLHLYGTYDAPLDIFAKYNQPDMAELYSKTATVPLTFGAGYHWSAKTANLIVATAHAPTNSQPAAATPASHTHR